MMLSILCESHSVVELVNTIYLIVYVLIMNDSWTFLTIAEDQAEPVI